jgi:predicted phosphodiesterase
MYKTLLFVMVVLIVAAGIIPGDCQAQTIKKGPYLAEPGRLSMTIRWECDQPDDTEVYFWPDESPGKTHKARLIGEKFGAYLYEAQLTGLQPDTKYFYQVIIGNTKSPVSYFKTTPEKKSAIKFIAMGDSRSNPDIFKVVVDRANNLAPDFIISMGDLVENGGNYQQWEDFYFGVVSDVINHIPLISTLGDHEGDGDNGELFRYFLYPDLSVNALWFSFDYGAAHFVSLDYRHPDNEEMIEWFKTDMSETDAKWKFVYYHRPSYNLGGHRSTWGKEIWPALFREYQVDIVFAGHSHIYERFYPLRPSAQPDAWPVTYITTAGAGAGLYEIVEHPYLAVTKSINHFSYIELNDDQLNFSVYLNDGSVLDQFSITKTSGKYDSAYLSLVKPQEELDVLGIFASAISPTLSSIPLFEEPARVNIEMESSLIPIAVEYVITLSGESENFYRMEPVKGLLQQGKNEKVTLNIYSKKELTLGRWGEIYPQLRLQAIYKTASGEEKIIGSAIDYWPEEGY